MRQTLILIAMMSLASPHAEGADARPQGLNAQRTETKRIIVQRRGMHGDIQTIRLDNDATASDVQRELSRLQARNDVAYAVVDQRRHAHAIPSDALYSSQWFLQSTQPSAIDATAAWDITTGGGGTVVAVLDTGVRFDHPDLRRAAQSGKLLPGFDFVSGESTASFLTANDGDGWDSDPTDPGDWISGADQQRPLFTNCQIKNSSWHGTRVAGLIGAASNNGIGISGVSWSAYILPVRVLGKCGGYDSDILPAMRWAAGLSVSGVPDNPYPAKILNMSLGSADPCNPAYQSVIQELAAMGVLVIASGGNDGGPVNSPANCPLVLGVAGLRHAGTKVGYSSLGSEIAIAAPAGNCFNLSGPCLFSLHTTFDVGTTTPAGSDYTNQFSTNLGTSFSAPLAAGVAALMHAANGKLSNAQLYARLREGARAFPISPDLAVPTCHIPVSPNDFQIAECNCTTAVCGAGMLHAPSALAAAQRPIASIAAPVTFTAGSAITLDALASTAACNRAISSYLWSVVSATGTSPPVLAPDNQPALAVNAPSSGTYTLRITVTDSQGATDSGEIIIDSTGSTNLTGPGLSASACPATITITQEPSSAAVPSNTPASSGEDGGGGALTWHWFFLLALARLRVRRIQIPTF